MTIGIYKEHEQYLDLIKKDEFYNSIKTTEESYTEEFKKNIRYLIYQHNYNAIKLIGTFKQYYVDGISFTEYFNNIVTSLGDGDFNKGFNILMQEFNTIADKITITTTNINREDIIRFLFIRNFYQPYNGFLSESIIGAIIESSGLFTVYTDDTLDKEYKIDLVISCNVEGLEGYKVGLQCKTHTFKHIKAYTMQEYKNGNEKAIAEGIVNDIYYVLSKDLNIVGTTITKGLEHYTNISSFMDLPFNLGSGYIPITEEEFIKALLYKFYSLKEEEKLKNNPFGSLLKINIRNSYEEWYKLNFYGKIKKKCLSKPTYKI